MSNQPKITPTVRVPVGDEVADQPSLPPFSQVAPCDDASPPAGRQQTHLFGTFDD